MSTKKHQHSEALIQFSDLVGGPIKSLNYEVKHGPSLLAKGSTNAKGETASIRALLGDTIDIYVERLTNKEMKLVQSVKLTLPNVIIKLSSPKLLLEMGLVLHEGETGNYRRKTYTVKSGDNLFKIAKSHHSTINELVQLNQIKDVNTLSIGQILKLPLKEPPATSSPKPPNKPKPTATPNAATSPSMLDQLLTEGEKILNQIKSLDLTRGENGSPKADVKNLCKDQSACIKKGSPKSELIREINIRLAAFGGALPTDEFTDLTETCVKQFQRDYMKVTETGRVCGGTLAALDDFMAKYPIDTLFNQMTCPCKQCTGFGNNQRDISSGVHTANEYPGMHRSLMWVLRAAMHYTEVVEKDLGFSINGINSGYRCIANNKIHGRHTVNHMGMALDLRIKKNGETVRSELDSVRKSIFEKYMRATLGTRKDNAIFLESKSEGATSWVHFDITTYNVYRADTFFKTNSRDADGETLINLAKASGLQQLRLCAGNGAFLPKSPKDEARRTPIAQLSLSTKGANFIKDWEKFKDHYYEDKKGFCTVGWGHLVHGEVSCNSLGIPVGKKITLKEAEELFTKDKEDHENLVRRAIHAPLYQHEFDALCSLAFNVGSIAQVAPKMCKKINAGNYSDAAIEFLDMENETRRKQENAMFLTANYDSKH